MSERIKRVTAGWQRPTVIGPEFSTARGVSGTKVNHISSGYNERPGDLFGKSSIVEGGSKSNGSKKQQPQLTPNRINLILSGVLGLSLVVFTLLIISR